MRKQRAVLALGLSMIIGVTFAQAPAAPQPGPQHKAMGFFAGKWKTETQMKASAFGAGGKVITQDNCEWFSGGFQMICHTEGTTPMGPLKSIGIIAYSEAEKSYTHYSIDNMGMGDLSKGSKDGKTWKFTSDSEMGGHKFKTRFTAVETSPTSYTFKWETSPDGTNWDTIMEGKTTKVGG